MIPSIALEEIDGPSGAPLLVLGPSLGTSTLLWSRVLPLLSRSFRIAQWDLPGHGLARPARESFTVAEIGDAVIGALDELDSTPFYYAGVSLGGAVGLEILLRYPGRVRGATIICSGAVIGSSSGWDERAAAVRTTGTAALVVPSAQRWFAPGSMERDPDITGRLLHALRDADDESYALCCDALAGYDVRSRLGQISTPLLALWGQFDLVTPEASAREIASGVVDGQIAVVNDASHLAPAEQPAAVAAWLSAFFSVRTKARPT